LCLVGIISTNLVGLDLMKIQVELIKDNDIETCLSLVVSIEKTCYRNQRTFLKRIRDFKDLLLVEQAMLGLDAKGAKYNFQKGGCAIHYVEYCYNFHFMDSFVLID
jgi:hypothetical protein